MTSIAEIQVVKAQLRYLLSHDDSAIDRLESDLDQALGIGLSEFDIWDQETWNKLIAAWHHSSQ